MAWLMDGAGAMGVFSFFLLSMMMGFVGYPSE